MVHIRPARPDDVSALTGLFDGYLRFYRREHEPAAIGGFLLQRLTRGDSLILLALDEGGAAVGFSQVYPLFTSLGLAPTWLLNDLFVASQARRTGAGRALLREVKTRAVAEGIASVELATEVTNSTAQALYEDEGFVRDTEYLHYEWTA
jgi:ribosomal protein S18 acetylase RimI-like enzyme